MEGQARSNVFFLIRKDYPFKGPPIKGPIREPHSGTPIEGTHQGTFRETPFMGANPVQGLWWHKPPPNIFYFLCKVPSAYKYWGLRRKNKKCWGVAPQKETPVSHIFLNPQGGRCCKAPGFQMNFDYLRLWGAGGKIYLLLVPA